MTIELQGLGWMGGLASGVPQVRTPPPPRTPAPSDPLRPLHPPCPLHALAHGAHAPTPAARHTPRRSG